MSLTKWNPGKDFFPTVSSLVGNFFKDDDFINGWRTGRNLPAVNIAETKEAYSLEVAAPGLKKEDFKITVEKWLMRISGENQSETEEEKDNYQRREFSYQSFHRSFWLPENANPDVIRAKYEDGLLLITIPKRVVDSVEEKKAITVD
ncbi:MAG: Hsp20/alpha crystallin family protein [Saprospiraceae bacterium]|nr:Hsp20/alpha crystallin family protein [Saprospiraceae bacterium]